MALCWNDAWTGKELRSAMDAHSAQETWALMDELLEGLRAFPSRLEDDVVKVVIDTLRSMARFEDLEHFARMQLDEGHDTHRTRQRLAQALIEQGRLGTALAELDAMQARIEAAREALAEPDKGLDKDLGECLGLLGRVYKQLWVDAGPCKEVPRSRDLERSLAAYWRPWEEGLGDTHWCGVNWVAVRAKAARVLGDRAGMREAQAVARTILEQQDALDASAMTMWTLANRAECFLALRKIPEATRAMIDYLEHEGEASYDRINAFEVRGTLRQMRELWDLTEEAEPGKTLLPLLEARLAEVGGRALEDSPFAPAPETHLEASQERIQNLERVFNKTRYKPLCWLHDALERARCVARVGTSVKEGSGTGFLFDPAWIDRNDPDFALAGRHFLLTNSHVTTHDEELLGRWPHPLGPGQCGVTFLAGESEERVPHVRILRYLWTSAPKELDATLVEIEDPGGGRTPPPRATVEPCHTRGDARLNVIGHPRGLPPQVSLQDNALHSVEEPLIFYISPTEGGSSGSPVFDQTWHLVALHHAADRKRKANEGILLSSLLDAMRADKAKIMAALAADPLP